MSAEKGNRYAQKHTRDDVIRIAYDIIDGLMNYDVIEKKARDSSVDGYSELKTITRSGYSCLTRGLFAHGLYPAKLAEWLKTHKEDEEVSKALRLLKATADGAILVNTAEGLYSAPIGQFLCKTVLGMQDVQVVQQTDKKYVCKNEDSNDSK